MFTPPGVAVFKERFDRDFPYSATGVNATAAATINGSGQILSVAPVDRGAGYTSVPQVTVVDADDGPGTGAVITATVANGQVTSYGVSAGGAGYVNPQITVTGGGVDPTNMDYVRDVDILRALTQTSANFNPLIWGGDDVATETYLLKTAHYLCLNLRGSTQGLRGRGGEWLRNAFNVGDVSASFDYPERIRKSLILAPFMETTYGSQYLQLLAPRLVANVQAVCGHTKP